MSLTSPVVVAGVDNPGHTQCPQRPAESLVRRLEPARPVLAILPPLAEGDVAQEKTHSPRPQPANNCYRLHTRSSSSLFILLSF